VTAGKGRHVHSKRGKSRANQGREDQYREKKEQDQGRAGRATVRIGHRKTVAVQVKAR
jgi:hypothetical protein